MPRLVVVPGRPRPRFRPTGVAELDTCLATVFDDVDPGADVLDPSTAYEEPSLDILVARDAVD